MRSVSFIKFTPGIAWFFLLNFLCCLPGSDLPTADTWMNTIYFDKWVHVGLFGGLAFLFTYPVFRSSFTAHQKWRYALKVALATSIWGITIEFIQKFYIPGRSFDLFDWAADSLGALLALLFARYRIKRVKTA